ncbi:CGNR zinc finger domain-containing protein [Actinomadura atramentaria]|uniref:CGNR zinc finger domain-containing protein n=1 Tax=Actinomadura atramentaria TaxID=1990 RepID=UPI000371216C|nr:CGNR zinc finger domain-containing protein [Actinomadura atramentaria]
MTAAEPAGPPAALLLRDFVNTLDVDAGTEELTDPGRLALWLHGRGLVPADAAAAPADLDTALDLREGLRAAMLAHHGPRTVPEPADHPALDAVLAGLPLTVSLAGDGPALVPAATGVRAGLGRLAAALMESAADGSWPRLKVCPESTCAWAFLDTSKNRSRTWCSMRVCGNRTKTRAYRARRTAPA